MSLKTSKSTRSLIPNVGVFVRVSCVNESLGLTPPINIPPSVANTYSVDRSAL
uniref:Uncharacterized protein n=1 Tax=uncultured marine virus TaxID=186617 RepID=A0A0F7L8Q5_9VIRU|nr:hypothetical protein [uncultured marine virus]